MDEMHVGTELFTLQEVEDFIFSQPVITEKESDLRESVRKFKVHSSWLCKWKGCNKCEVYIKGNELEDFEGDY
ncbi:MAG: hypothetical protein GWO26_22595, partial [Phycisphaerae bacterium]|nr:hypothetical protein [Phycisphaerae bacterium]